MVSFKSQYDHIQSLASAFPESTTLILQVYQDLALNKLWKTIHVIPIPNLDTCVLQAHEPGTPEDDQLLIIPIRHDEALSTEKIAGLFQGLDQSKLQTNGLMPSPSKRITLAIVARDSTVLYYHISKGLSPPKEQ
ncbi:Sen15 protein-domain-containing protein [Absidia repens]|uniref:Sen15 protein-domain-containing protein n=1 Tax=Absidia repens TaxID=90262 RepID=A0A1X2INV3_9FUNG|nr:Sen15 protein-domain-containing protein [Absidia repens]